MRAEQRVRARRGTGRSAAAVLIVVLLALSAGTAAAAPLAEEPRLTLDKTTGGELARFTLNGRTGADAAPIEAFIVTFPEDSETTSATAKVSTLEGLARTPLTATVSPDGFAVTVSIEPSIGPATAFSLVVDDVRTPDAGGEYVLSVSALTEGGIVELAQAPFQLEDAPVTLRIVRWMDGQAWVQWLDSIPLIHAFFQPQLIVLSIPLLFFGFLLSLALTLVSYPLGMPIGLAGAFMKMSRIAPVRWIAGAYVNFIRGTPLFLQMYIAFFGLPLIGINPNEFALGIVVLAVNSGAYLAEIFRAGIESINRGQREAALSLGMSYPQAMGWVIIPQTVRRVLPTMTSEFILLFKDTALLSAVGVFELMLYAKNAVANAGNTTPYVVAAFYYLLVTIPLIRLVQWFEGRLALSETGRAAPEKAAAAGKPAPKKPATEVE